MSDEDAQPVDPPSGGGRRLGAVTIDQAISGGSNVLAAILAARSLSPADFGYFTIAFLVYVVLQGSARALVCDPLLLRPEEAERRPGDAIGSGLLVGGLVALVAALGAGVAALVHGPLGLAMLVLAACMPLLVVQDLGRYLGFATRRPRLALELDVTWLLLLLLATVGLTVLGSPTLVGYMAVWAGSGAVAGLLTLVQHRGIRIRASRTWLRETWYVSWRYLVSWTFAQGSSLAAAVLVAGILGARVLGGVQAALLLQRPFMTVQVAVVASGVNDVVRIASDRAAVLRHARRATAVTTGFALANGTVMVLFPDAWGKALFADSWALAEGLVWAAAAQILGMSLVVGARLAMIGSHRIREALWIDLVGIVVVLTLTIIGATAGGAEASMWAVAGAHVLTAGLWWAVLHRMAGSPGPIPSADPSPAGGG